MVEGLWRLESLEKELGRLRDRIHEMEGDRATIQLLTERLTNVINTLSGLREDMRAQVNDLRADVAEVKDDQKATRRAVLTGLIGVASSAILFAATIFFAFH